jgi:hypothetical protein
MNRYLLAVASMAALLLVSSARADAQEFSAKFSGFNEVPLAILSDGKGTLKLNLDRVMQTITYELTYSGLTSDVKFAHIHFGKIHVAGNIIVFLCKNPVTVGIPTCPLTGGTVTGTIHAGDVIGQPTQNIIAGDFDALEDALTSNTAYGNIHTTKFPAGEIRGEIRRSAD